jgi:flagellar hook-basal body complex protein FliE
VSIAPIGAAEVGRIAIPFVAPTLAAGAATADPSAFAAQLDKVAGLTEQADGLATGVATGGLENVHDFTSAASKAQLGVELTVALRNKAVEAYQDIMRMQV